MPIYSKGRVNPNNMQERHEISWIKYGKALLNLPDITAPSWDCRNLGLVGPIKDQGQCGSCWDYSGTAIVESALVKAGVGPADTIILSEQYTLSCYQNGGCNGDDNTTVLEHAKTTGLPLTTEYGPYEGGPGRCKTVSKLYKIDNWGYIDKQDGVANTQLIKNAMAAFGPIGSAIAADNAFMNNPAGHVFQGSGSQNIDHDIALVGWDDSTQSWILRNSWGLSWCDNGYCKIKYGANLVGYAAVFATVSPSVIDWYL